VCYVQFQVFMVHTNEIVGDNCAFFNERYDPDSNVFYAATLLEYLRRIHLSSSPLSTFCRAREQEVTKDEKNPSHQTSRQTQEQGPENKLPTTLLHHTKNKRHLRHFRRPRVVSQLSQCRQVAKDDLMLKLTLQRVRRALPCVCGQIDTTSTIIARECDKHPGGTVTSREY
jgi:hypothetical protein